MVQNVKRPRVARTTGGMTREASPMQAAVYAAALTLALAPTSQAQTATAVQRDATTVDLTVRVQAKRNIERRVFAEPCGLPSGVLFCDAQELSKEVRLHKGANTVKLKVQRLRYHFVGTDVTGTPWDGYAFVAAPVDAVWWRFGQGRARQVMPSPVAHDTLEDKGAA